MWETSKTFPTGLGNSGPLLSLVHTYTGTLLNMQKLGMKQYHEHAKPMVYIPNHKAMLFN